MGGKTRCTTITGLLPRVASSGASILKIRVSSQEPVVWARLQDSMLAPDSVPTWQGSCKAKSSTLLGSKGKFREGSRDREGRL